MSDKEFARRRRQLMREMGKDAIAVLPAAPEVIRNRDVAYAYRQDSDFLYLSDFPEPESVLVLIPERSQGQYILFCREKDDEKETWHGRRYGQEGAVEQFGADDSFPIDDINDILPGMLENKAKVFYTMGKYAEFDKLMLDMVNQLKANIGSSAKAPNEFVSLDYILHEARLHKSRAEISIMRKAANISATAHIRSMQACCPGKKEYELEAELIYEFQKNGAGLAYPCIVGGGHNGCILHYTENSDTLNEGDLVLVDAGCEFKGYASDITRTYPVSGSYSQPQKEVYEIVLEAQLAAIKKTVQDNHVDDPHNAAIRVLTKGLIELGLLKGHLNKLIKDRAYQRFYMHRTNHWIGLDVHDVGEYKLYDEWRLLESNMVMTIEPGLYIKAERGIPKRFHNIGVRIEDDIVITRDGNEVLSKGVPKSISEIESLMGGG